MDYEKVKNMRSFELAKLIKEAKTDKERIFYASIFNKKLQASHKEVINKGLF